LARAGISHALPANLYGVGPRFLGGAPGQERDIDILFIGNLHPAVQRERQPWLGRVARLAARRNVVIASGVFGDAYRALLRRAKIVFNRSARGEANMRCFEAAASGALLFVEAGNAEVGEHLRDGLECVCYGEDDLEALLERYLNDDGARTALADA